MRYPAIATRNRDLITVTFRDLPGLEIAGTDEAKLVRRASAALAGWLARGLRDGPLPPRPSRRFRLFRNQRLVWILVELHLSLQLALRWARAEAGLTQVQLSARSGLSQPQIARVERPGARPKLETIAKLAEAMGLRLDIELVPRSKPIP